MDPSQMNIVNVVLTGDVHCPMDLADISKDSYATYNPHRFSGLIWKHWRVCCLLFASGRMVLCGAKSEEDGVKHGRKYARQLRVMGYAAHFGDAKVQTMTATFDFGRRIHLESLYDQLRPHADFTPELFPAMMYKSDKKNATIFHTGKIIITGGKSKSDLHCFLNTLLEKMRWIES